jgi:hypothetical protein
MDDFDNYEELIARLRVASENSDGYRAFALISLEHGDYETARFQISQEFKWYGVYAAIRDAIKVGKVLSSEEYLDEFIRLAFEDDSPYLKWKEKVCSLMSWDAEIAHMDGRLIDRFIGECEKYEKDAVMVLKEGER